MASKGKGKGGSSPRGAKAIAPTEKAEVQRQRDKTRVALALVDKGTALTRHLVTVGGWMFVVYFGIYKSIEALAGKKTEFLSVFNWLADLKANQWIAYVVAIVSGGAAVLQRITNRKLIKKFGPRISELEGKIDQRRSSSQLLSDGTPRKEDLDD